jgi:hypothetical protein
MLKKFQLQSAIDGLRQVVKLHAWNLGWAILLVDRDVSNLSLCPPLAGTAAVKSMAKSSMLFVLHLCSQSADGKKDPGIISLQVDGRHTTRNITYKL